LLPKTIAFLNSCWPDCEQFFSGLYYHAFCVNLWLKPAKWQKVFNKALLLLKLAAAANYLFFTLNVSLLKLRPNG
jgi:hypothetical protein